MFLTYGAYAINIHSMSLRLLLGPDCRAAILARTHLEPAREYHLRELVRLTGFAPRTVQQEVNRLVGAELLGERRHGNRRYLGANRHHPLFHAVREIVVKTEGIAPVLREALGTDGIEFAFVFGATAAREPAASSPVDVLIVGTAGAGEIERRLIPARDALGREIQPLVWTREEFERRLAEMDPFLGGVLKGPRLSLLKVERQRD
jgi:predicted nucleotidyltransferase